MRPLDSATIGILSTSGGVTHNGTDVMKIRIQDRGMNVKAVMNLSMNEPVGPAGSGFVAQLLSK
jgi:hypothetical protein